LFEQIKNFPAEFLLFVKHVRGLVFSAESEKFGRKIELKVNDDEHLIQDGAESRRWKLFKHVHCLSNDAQDDSRPMDDRDKVPIWWAAPTDQQREPGRFWAFFPTLTASLVGGILNAPWRTTEDHEHLLPGIYNEELVTAAAKMIADALPSLSSSDDPARHLDVLPRRPESNDPDQANLLRDMLYIILRERNIVPDLDGNLRHRKEISYPPREFTSFTSNRIDSRPLERWAAYPERPSDWLHHTALKGHRLSAINRLHFPSSHGKIRWADRALFPRTAVANWLEALAQSGQPEDKARSSIAAISVAAFISETFEAKFGWGNIVLTAAGTLRDPDSEYLLMPDEFPAGSGSSEAEKYVHASLVSDAETYANLKSLGLRGLSPEGRFSLMVERLVTGDRQPRAERLEQLWRMSRDIEVGNAWNILRKCQENRREAWAEKFRVRARSGNWHPLWDVLLPGEVVARHGSEDEDVAVDLEFHRPDFELLRILGVADGPRCNSDLSIEPWFNDFLDERKREFISRPLPAKPHLNLLAFRRTRGVGPLEVLCRLTPAAAARYTEALLSSNHTYEPWTMYHTRSLGYPDLECDSPTVWMLRKHGWIRLPGGSEVPLKQALGDNSECPAALDALHRQPKADRIRNIFNLSEPNPESFRAQDPVPIVDEWPTLRSHPHFRQKRYQLIRCERLLVAGMEQSCAVHGNDVYLAGSDDNDCSELHLIGRALGLGALKLSSDSARRDEFERAREEVRRRQTDPERLLAAVGEGALRNGLPASLLHVLDGDPAGLTGTEIAEAAIAIWHTDALRKHRDSLERLDPPYKWKGSKKAVHFVRSLGFSSEWAGERGGGRPPFLEIEGPYSLPILHDYQRIIVENIQDLLRSKHGERTERRGMISMPTGSGKTRVAVQAIVEAMRDDGFGGGVLWIADRDELCEQAVEAWRQVWSSEGAQASRLRISRLWAGQPAPLPTTELHVVVATIQTLHAKLSGSSKEEYQFLANFKLVVFDEAHRSTTRTSTSVMEEIGLTRYRRASEPFLIGLTATPYKGHDEVETKRLVNRYGSNRLDRGAFAGDDPQEVVRELQSMKVLAQADHDTIEGETFSRDTLSAKEWEWFLVELGKAKEKKLPWLPQRVEERIAQSSERTRRIVEAYEEHIIKRNPEWPTIVFATSVEHARTVAALLNRKGIVSRALSGDTEPATRRRLIEEFRCGEIKALVNYAVLREGFDAPKTRAIIVARPVYSPNLYFQMIGRGLRGPANGGDDRCLILNVADNIEKFDRKLAFTELDWLWAR